MRKLTGTLLFVKVRRVRFAGRLEIGAAQRARSKRPKIANLLCLQLRAFFTLTPRLFQALFKMFH